MDKIRAMQVFVRIVDANSFTKAAETLNLPRATLTATLQALEAHLGARLLQRTTRRLSLTPEGERYYRQCAEILAAVDAAEAPFLGAERGAPQGQLRVALPSSLGRALVVPRIGEFRAACPGITLGVQLGDRVVDLTEEGLDCAVRVGSLQDSALVARPLGCMRFVIVASPGYLAAHGTPASVEELAAHQGIVHFSGRNGRAFDWELDANGTRHRLMLQGPVAVNEADANLSCALQGLGLAQVGRYQARSHLASGALVEVLPGVVPTPMPVSLVYPQGRMALPRLQVFAAWLGELFAADPDLCLAR